MRAVKKTPVAILVRVSTSKQETDRQISELRKHAEANDYEIVQICKETISGGADEDLRHGLHCVEELAKEKRIEKVLVHEISRIARKNSIAHAFIERLEEQGVSLYWHQQGVETLLKNGKRNPATSLMFALLAEMARAEKEMLSVRIKSGLEEAKRKGKKLGRPSGSTLEEEEMLLKHSAIVRRLKKGQPIREIATLENKGVSTVQRVKKILASC